MLMFFPDNIIISTVTPIIECDNTIITTILHVNSQCYYSIKLIKTYGVMN